MDTVVLSQDEWENILTYELELRRIPFVNFWPDLEDLENLIEYMKEEGLLVNDTIISFYPECDRIAIVRKENKTVVYLIKK